jgi:large subunit ribosomal protein L17
MRHQNGRRKLNLKPAHKRSMLRNQMISLITYGHVVSTKTCIKELRRFAEKIVTVAREGNDFNVRRRVNALLPYDAAVARKLVVEIAPRYVERPGGYTRIIPLGRRVSDTADIARLEWV